MDSNRKDILQLNMEQIRFLELGLNIAYYRKLRGLSQKDLAEKANLSKRLITMLERPTGEKSLSMQKFFAIADALCVHPGKLLEIRSENIDRDKMKETES